jgi:MFS family permease
MTIRKALSKRSARLASAYRSGPLSVPAFRLLAVGQFSSTIGDYCYAVALPWLVLSNRSSAASLGIALACYGVPRALLTLPGGSLADRFGPRLMMLSSDAVRCAVTTVFTVLAALHVSSLAVVAPMGAVLGACSALFLPASMTMMPSLIDSAKLTSANALYTGFVQTGSMLGPLIGGILVAFAGPPPAFAVDAGSYLISAACLALVGRSVARPARPEPGRATPTEQAVSQANQAAEPVAMNIWTLLRRDRFLRIVLVVSVTANFAVTGITEVAPVLGGLPGLAAGLSVFGLALGFDNAVWGTLIQRWAPPELLGRVWGVLMLAPTVSFPLSTLIAGVLTRHLGPIALFPFAGALLALSYLYGLSHREFRELGKPQQAP